MGKLGPIKGQNDLRYKDKREKGDNWSDSCTEQGSAAQFEYVLVPKRLINFRVGVMSDF